MGGEMLTSGDWWRIPAPETSSLHLRTLPGGLCKRKDLGHRGSLVVKPFWSPGWGI